MRSVLYRIDRVSNFFEWQGTVAGAVYVVNFLGVAGAVPVNDELNGAFDVDLVFIFQHAFKSDIVFFPVGLKQGL